MIENSARYLSTSHGCIVLIPFDHMGFLVSMGQRSVPALHRQIADPAVGMNSKIHLAWVLGRVGDHSQFSVFIRGLGSKRHQAMAAMRMQDFPHECWRHLPAILAQSRQPQHHWYWSMLMLLADQSALPPDRKEALLNSMAECQPNKDGLSANEIQELRQHFGV
jgi:hypothetical protein